MVGPRDDLKGGVLPLLPFGNPIGFVPASRGEVYIRINGKFSNRRRPDQ